MPASQLPPTTRTASHSRRPRIWQEQAGERLVAYCIGHNLDGSHFYTKAQQEQHKERHNRCHNYIR